MKNDEDIVNKNRPEPNENSFEKQMPNYGISEALNKVEPGIRRSLTFYRSSKIKDVEKRIAYLKRKLKEYKQGIRNSYEYYDEYDFDKCISLEIENLQEEHRRSLNNGKYIKVIDDYDHKLIAAIYSLCVDCEVFNYSYLDFIKYIETAHFEVKEGVLPNRKFRHLIYFLQTPLGTTWYKSVVEHSRINVKRFGGLSNEQSIKNFVKELDKVYADNKKNH